MMAPTSEAEHLGFLALVLLVVIAPFVTAWGADWWRDPNRTEGDKAMTRKKNTNGKTIPQDEPGLQVIELTGEQIKEDNGSGYRLSDTFAGRRYRDTTLYRVYYNGVKPDGSTVKAIVRAR